MSQQPFSRIAVYCASNDGAHPGYVATARALGTLLAERGLAVVYGGGRTGLMGALADSALAAGGEVIGVMPHGLVQREVAHHGLTALHIVDSMHDRKARIAAWAQLGVHRKPVGVLDVQGFWDPLFQMLERLEQEQFLRGTPRDWLVRSEDPASLLDQLQAFEPPQVRRWLRLGDT
jgi:predicted Rossmann-fold nucleotide-binding protein